MKYQVILLAVCLCGNVAFAVPAEDVSDKDFANAFAEAAISKAKEQAAIYKPVWEDLLTCSPSQTGDGILKVYGYNRATKECHFVYANQDCTVPADIAKQYASAALKGVTALEKGDFNTESPENTYMESINNNQTYCQIK